MDTVACDFYCLPPVCVWQLFQIYIALSSMLTNAHLFHLFLKIFSHMRLNKSGDGGGGGMAKTCTL